MLLRDFVQNPGKFRAAIEEDTQREYEHEQTWSVVEWGVSLGHPLAVRMSSFDTHLRHAQDAYAQRRLAEKRLQNRERQERIRQRKNSLPKKRYALPS